jgi:hypothetical protein
MRGAIVLLLGAVVSCFPESFSINDAGPMDAGTDVDREDARDSGGPDVPTTDAIEPIDVGLDAAPSNNINVPCPMRWAELDPDPPQACAGRRVTIVGEGLDSSAVDIALLESREVALAWNANIGFDSGGIELRVLNADTVDVTRSANIEPEAVIGEVAGTSISVVSEGDDVHLAYWLRSDFGSTIEYRHWSPELLSLAQTISAQVGRSGTVSLGVSARGDTTFAFHDLVMGRHFSRLRLQNGDLEPTIELEEDFERVPVDSPAISLVHANGISHLAYRRRFAVDRSAPFYRRHIVGDGWSTTSTLDGVGTSRYSGIAIDIAVFGDQVAVAYLDWSSGQTELRLAMWETTPGDVEIQVLTTYRSVEAPVYTPLDIEFDGFGLLHILFADDAGNRSLEYWREMANGTGWVRDTIIELTPEADLLARLVVGPARRPHIVFAARGDIHYATITP